MNQGDLRDLLRVRPIRPFRLHMTDGSHYDVRHPDMVILISTSVGNTVPRRGTVFPTEVEINPVVDLRMPEVIQERSKGTAGPGLSRKNIKGLSGQSASRKTCRARRHQVNG